MRGAAHLSGLENAMVVDVGGTTGDIGQLRHGFPREANAFVEVGGVRTLFRMPDLLSIGLGGGSHIDPASAKIGPLSVGYRLTQDALVFGGAQLTATDIAVAAGLLDVGDRSRIASISKDLIAAALTDATRQLEENIDRMKTEAGDAPLVPQAAAPSWCPKSWLALRRSSASPSAIAPMPLAQRLPASAARPIKSSAISHATKPLRRRWKLLNARRSMPARIPAA